jgi:hypothetical protein
MCTTPSGVRAWSSSSALLRTGRGALEAVTNMRVFNSRLAIGQLANHDPATGIFYGCIQTSGASLLSVCGGSMGTTKLEFLALLVRNDACQSFIQDTYQDLWGPGNPYNH